MTEMHVQHALHRQTAAWFTAMAMILSGTSALRAAGKDRAKSTSSFPEEENPSLVQAIRRLLDLPQTVAVGGSRSSSRSSICLITPVVDQESYPPTAIAVVPEPVIVTAKPLNELTIKQTTGDKKIIYRQIASSKQAIQTPLTWPLEPIKAGEIFTLELRPLGAPAGNRATIIIQGAEQENLERNKSIIETINRNPEELAKTIQTTSKTKAKFSINLLYSKSDQHEDRLKAWQIKTTNKACSRE